MSDLKPERRAQRRVSARVPVTVRQAEGPRSSAYTRDVSTGGIFLYCNSQIELGSELEMVLILPSELMDGESYWVCCQATVVRVSEPGHEGEFGIAASIKNLQVLPEIPS
jgi:c-di-GMP-binding flagellar brake protein YcgR